MNKELIGKLLMMLLTEADYSESENSLAGKHFFKEDDYIIVRCRDAGVWAGNYQYHKDNAVCIKNGRRLYNWTPVTGMTLSACAITGVNDYKSKLSDAILAPVLLNNFCELLHCTISAENTIKGAKQWK
jgi:hypothetical protein